MLVGNSNLIILLLLQYIFVKILFCFKSKPVILFTLQFNSSKIKLLFINNSCKLLSEQIKVLNLLFSFKSNLSILFFEQSKISKFLLLKRLIFSSRFFEQFNSINNVFKSIFNLVISFSLHCNIFKLVNDSIPVKSLISKLLISSFSIFSKFSFRVYEPSPVPSSCVKVML